MQKIRPYVLGLFYFLSLMFVLPVHAGIFDSKSQNALSELQALQQSSLQQYQPISASALTQASCADLAVYASNNQRDLQSLMTYAQNVSQIPSQKQEKSGLLKALVSTGASLIPGGSLIAEAATNSLVDGAKSLLSFNRERKQNQQSSDQVEAILGRYRLQQQEGQFIQMERHQKGCVA